MGRLGTVAKLHLPDKQALRAAIRIPQEFSPVLHAARYPVPQSVRDGSYRDEREAFSLSTSFALRQRLG